MGLAQPGGAAEAPPRPASLSRAPEGKPVRGGNLLGLLLGLLHALYNLPHEVPGLPLQLDRLGLTRALHLQHVLHLANIRQSPSHELHRACLLLLPALLLATLLLATLLLPALLLPALLLPALLLTALLLTALCHRVSSPSRLRPRFAYPRALGPGKSFPGASKLDRRGTGIVTAGDVCASGGGGTKAQRRRRDASFYGETA